MEHTSALLSRSNNSSEVYCIIVPLTPVLCEDKFISEVPDPHKLDCEATKLAILSKQ